MKTAERQIHTDCKLNIKSDIWGGEILSTTKNDKVYLCIYYS